MLVILMKLGTILQEVSEWHDAPSVVEPEDLKDRKTNQGMPLFLSNEGKQISLRFLSETDIFFFC